MTTPKLPSSEALIRPGWEVGGSIFKTFELLSTFSKSLTADNVHPESILAAEAIGAGLTVAAERLHEGIEALKGHENYRLLQTRITLGLHYGNTQRVMRQSTALLQFFVFISAFKLIFVNDEIADILFEMLSSTGLYKRHPVSASMFCQLLDQIGGQAESLAPRHTMSEIATKLADFDPPREVYHRLDTEALAKMFVKLFEAVRDDEILSIRLEGCLNGVWLATMIAWLLPKRYSFSYNDTRLLGNPEGKTIEIVITSAPSVSWSIESWSKFHNPDKLIVHQVDDSPILVGRLPLTLIANFYSTHYWMFSLRTTKKSNSTDLLKSLTTQVASSLISVMLTNGSLILPRLCCSNGEHSCSRVNLSRIASKSWLNNLRSVLKSYGLGEYNVQQELTQKIESSLKDAPDFPFPVRAMERVCEEFVCHALGDDYTLACIMWPAYSIALDAILSCTTQVVKATRYASHRLTVERFDTPAVIAELIRGQIEISRFQGLVLECLLPGYREITTTSSTLAIASSGLVIGMKILRGISSDQHDSLGFVYSCGSIKKDNVQFTSIKDTPGSTLLEKPWSAMPQVDEPSMAAMARDGLLPRDPRGSISFDLETQVSAKLDTLSLRQYLVIRVTSLETAQKLRVSWLDAAYALATAYHIDFNCPTSPIQTSRSAQQWSLQNRKRKWEPAQDVRWVQIYGVEASIDAQNRCMIADTAGNELAKIFCAARYAPHDECYACCHKLFVYHSGSFQPFFAERSKWPSSILII